MRTGILELTSSRICRALKHSVYWTRVWHFLLTGTVISPRKPHPNPLFFSCMGVSHCDFSLASAVAIDIVPSESKLWSQYSTCKRDHMSPAWIPLKLSTGLTIAIKILNAPHHALSRLAPSWPPNLLCTSRAHAQGPEPPKLVSLRSSSSPFSLLSQGLWISYSLSLQDSPLPFLKPPPLGPGKSYHLPQRAFSRPLRSFCCVVLHYSPLCYVYSYVCVIICLITAPSYVRTEADSAFAHLYP